jgi:hypothetical protein
MDMVAHENPCINFQSFVGLAKPYTFQKNIPVILSAENINPIYNSKRNEIAFALVSYFILGTHKVKVEIPIINSSSQV